MKILGLFTAAAILLGANSAFAAPVNLLTNGNFEQGPAAGSFTTLGNGSTAITGWVVGGDSVDYIGTLWKDSTTGSGHSVDLSGNNPGTLSQSVSLVSGQAYTVKFRLSANPDGPDTPFAKVNVSISGNPVNIDASFNTALASYSNMRWTDVVFNFVATGTSGTLTFASLTGSAYGPAIDDVSLTAVTPIPGAVVLFGSALGGLGFLGYRRRKAQAAA